ncbi:hypothetical protein DEFDS_P256 (plasmid) [Deferribacter desulfuricans SSM1]|uniref:VWFA domain-containing protein n=1 Tax=Deferribacter desulfuricans (strain DSM 14783 / JCM 11476 / NBRC 101012 / SSM1) TaxID=639282 RepID=D3PF84_DEFDS|nr:hypothetical protein [Deferribacter desulfuricans]BAI81876.1 hypothetical protein DEFDS_P256 [Deferribacter desulfuricans SSM1]
MRIILPSDNIIAKAKDDFIYTCNVPNISNPFDRQVVVKRELFYNKIQSLFGELVLKENRSYNKQVTSKFIDYIKNDTNNVLVSNFGKNSYGSLEQFILNQDPFLVEYLNLIAITYNPLIRDTYACLSINDEGKQKINQLYMELYNLQKIIKNCKSIETFILQKHLKEFNKKVTEFLNICTDLNYNFVEIQLSSLFFTDNLSRKEQFGILYHEFMHYYSNVFGRDLKLFTDILYKELRNLTLKIDYIKNINELKTYLFKTFDILNKLFNHYSNVIADAIENERLFELRDKYNLQIDLPGSCITLDTLKEIDLVDENVSKDDFLHPKVNNNDIFKYSYEYLMTDMYQKVKDAILNQQFQQFNSQQTNNSNQQTVNQQQNNSNNSNNSQLQSNHVNQNQQNNQQNNQQSHQNNQNVNNGTMSNDLNHISKIIGSLSSILQDVLNKIANNPDLLHDILNDLQNNMEKANIDIENKVEEQQQQQQQVSENIKRNLHFNETNKQAGYGTIFSEEEYKIKNNLIKIKTKNEAYKKVINSIATKILKLKMETMQKDYRNVIKPPTPISNGFFDFTYKSKSTTKAYPYEHIGNKTQELVPLFRSLIVFDTSASISKEEIYMFLDNVVNLINLIKKQFPMSKLMLSFVNIDSDLTKAEFEFIDFMKDNKNKLTTKINNLFKKISGGGGTEFKNLFYNLRSEEKNKKQSILLNDPAMLSMTIKKEQKQIEEIKNQNLSKNKINAQIIKQYFNINKLDFIIFYSDFYNFSSDKDMLAEYTESAKKSLSEKLYCISTTPIQLENIGNNYMIGFESLLKYKTFKNNIYYVYDFEPELDDSLLESVEPGL